MRRRDFLTAAGTGLGLLTLPRWARGAAPSDQVVMGAIGTGGRGSGVMKWLAALPDVRMVAVADCDDQHTAANVAYLRSRYRDVEVQGYHDFRRVLERDDVDAVCSGTPDHWHALVTCLAFQAGKDVYCEKPLCHNWRESQAMVALGRRHARLFQLGTQIHQGENYHRVVDLIRCGALGRVHTVHVWQGGGCRVRKWSAPPRKPAHLDYDLWLGPAPKRPYHPARCHFSFRYFLDYSTGVYADFWCHISDIAFWALGLGAPRTIVARGELQTEGMYDGPKRVEVDLAFPDGLEYHWTTGRPKQFSGGVGSGIGARFIGENGWLMCDYNGRTVCLGGDQTSDLPDVPKATPRSPGHHANFIEGVKTRTLTESNLPYAVRMTQPMFFGRISLLLGGRRLTWNDAAGQFVADDEANRLLGRVYREPWALPV